MDHRPNIEARLGVKPPALYKHVDNLADLQHRIAALAMSEFGDAAGDALQGKAGLDALTALFAALRSYVERRATAPQSAPGFTARTILCSSPDCA
jgi:AcrR family transcriptional regulator